MTYNYSGLWYDFYHWCSWLAYAVLAFILVRPWKEGIKSKSMLLMSLFVLFSLFMVLLRGSRIISPDIATLTDTYKYCYRYERTTYEYVVQYPNEEKLKSFYLDSSSKKKIFPNHSDELEKDCRYKISYETESRIIVRVEKIDDG